MDNSSAFAKHCRLEAERRGIRQAQQTIFMGDGGNWIEPLHQDQFFRCPRIIDYFHAVEHLHDVAKALYPHDEPRRQRLAEHLKTLLWTGRLDALVHRLNRLVRHAGTPQPGDADDQPRVVLTRNAAYFHRHRDHMRYPEYRAKGWPIATGVTESAVKLFNKRVKGTEQFWSEQGVEPILALRALWLSQDQRWNHYWLGPTARARAA